MSAEVIPFPTVAKPPDPGIEVTGVQRDEAGRILKTSVLRWVDKAIAGASDQVSLDGMRGLLEQGLAQLWVVWEPAAERILGVLITSVAEYEKSRSLLIEFAAGEALHRWAGWLSAVENWAAASGLDAVEIVGRPGWGRVTGYQEKHRVFKKTLGGEVHG